MADWLVEQGIGEHRAMLIEQGEIIAARIDWPGALTAGQIEDAVLASRTAGSARGTLRFASGEVALVDKLPREASDGSTIRAQITRAAMAETGRLKRAQARPTDSLLRAAPTLAERLQAEGHTVKIATQYSADWDELFAEAWHGEIAFPGGSITITPTPAMTLIDIDGTLPAAQLSIAAIPTIAAAIRRFDLSGSIGIDFPSLPEKADRRAVDAALAASLNDWPHESTAMNGFGFVQLVARLERPSLLHRIASGRAAAAARLLLRRAERVAEPGALLLTAHPKVRFATLPQWEVELAHRTGRPIRWADQPALALEAMFAQAVPL